MIRWILALATALVLGAPAWGDTEPSDVTTEPFGPKTVAGEFVYMCFEEADNGKCKRDPGTGTEEEIVLPVLGLASLAFHSRRSDATVYSCALLESDNGHDASGGTDLAPVKSSDGTDLVISNTNPEEAVRGVYGYLVFDCSGITGGGATITSIVAHEGRAR